MLGIMPYCALTILAFIFFITPVSSSYAQTLQDSIGTLTVASKTGPHSSLRIWLCGEDLVVQLQKHKNKPADYMDLFQSTSAWPYAAKHLNIFKISTQMALRSTDEQLKSVINGLKREGIEAEERFHQVESSPSLVPGKSISLYLKEVASFQNK